MNIKVQLDKKVHKLPKNNSINLDSVLMALYMIFKDKMPSKFKINITINQKEFGQISNEEDYQKALEQLKSQSGSMKLIIMRTEEEMSQTLRDQLEKSLVIDGQQTDQYLMMTSQIVRDAKKEEVQMKQNPESFKYEGSIFDDSIDPDTFRKLKEEQKQEEKERQNSQTKQPNMEEEEEEEKEEKQNAQKKQQNVEDYIDQPLYGCIDCQSDNKSCKRCQGKGFLTQNDNLIKLINQIVDHKIQRVLQAQQNAQGFPEIHERHTCDECSTHPIIGARYHCSVCEDYDICSFCEPITQHAHDFIKINRAKDNFGVPQEQQQQKHGQKIRDYFSNLKEGFINNFKGIVPEKENIVVEKKEEKEEQKPVKENKKPQNLTYKASFVQAPEGIVKTSGPNEPYTWSVVLKNNGETQWPENVHIYCIEGSYFGMNERVKPIQSQESYQIDLKLNSISAEDMQQSNGTHAVSWRLGYYNKQEDKHIHFGPKIIYELQFEKQNNDQKKAGISCQEADPKILSQNKNVLEKAEQLKEIFGGEEIKIYIDFITKNKHENVSHDRLVELYLENE